MTSRDFRFAVKMPRTITHDAKLKRTRPLVQKFLGEATALGEKLGPILVQLPPSLEFNARTAHAFFTLLREVWAGHVVCEPRHETWFTDRAEALLVDYRVGRVAADPPRIEAARQPGGWPGVTYYRLHGSPRTYWSRYLPARIGRWAADLRATESSSTTWCIFDNTASGAAIESAVEMVGLTAR